MVLVTSKDPIEKFRELPNRGIRASWEKAKFAVKEEIRPSELRHAFKENPLFTIFFVKEAEEKGKILWAKKVIRELGHKDLKEFLQAYGASLGWAVKLRCTPCAKALIQGVKEVNASLLEEVAADPEILAPLLPKAKEFGEALHVAAASSMESTRLLLEAGAGPNKKDKQGRTPLHYAEEPEVAELLIKQGANVNAQDKDGKTPLHTLPEAVPVLLKYGANPNIRDKEGKIPLHYAVLTHDSWAFKHLLPVSDINAQDNDGITPLFLAIEERRFEVPLIKRGADPFIRNRYGHTPFENAIIKNNLKALEAMKLTQEQIKAGIVYALEVRRRRAARLLLSKLQLPEQVKEALSFLAQDRREEVMDFFQLLVRNMENYSDPHLALLYPIFGTYPKLYQTITHKDILGRWNSRRWLIRVARLASAPPAHLAALDKHLAGTIKERSKLLSLYTTSTHPEWREAIIKVLGKPDIFKEALKTYLPFMPNIPEQHLHPFLAWVSVIKGEKYEDALRYFQEDRYQDFNVPEKLKKAWVPDWEFSITIKPRQDRVALAEVVKNELQFLRNQYPEVEFLEGETLGELQSRIERLLSRTNDAELKEELKKLLDMILLEGLGEEYTVKFTGKPWDLFYMGEGPFLNSCLSPTHSTTIKKTLAGIIANPGIKMLAIYDKEGKLIGRMRAYLLEGPHVVFDYYYGHPALKPVLTEVARKMGQTWMEEDVIKGFAIESNVFGDKKLLGPKRAAYYTEVTVDGGVGYHPPE